MNLKRYACLANNDFKSYEFYSEGPNGKIKKVVTFTKIEDEDIVIYNLAFGDENSETGDIAILSLQTMGTEIWFLQPWQILSLNSVIVMEVNIFMPRAALLQEQDFTK